MKIHLKELFDIEGDSKEIDCLIKPEEIKNELGEYSSYDFTVPIRLNGRVFNRAGIVTLEDVIETMLGFEIVDEKDEVVDMQELAKQQWKKVQEDMESENS